MKNYEIYPLPMARTRASEGYFTYLMNYDIMVDAIIYSWYIKGPKRNIIVDTSCPMDILLAHRPDSHEIMSFENALGKVGLTPEKVDIVILTQLHYDHVGNAAKCKNAEFIVQREELSFALAPHPVMAVLYHRELFSRLKLNIIEGDTEIEEGIRLLFTPGHSPGGQSVAVETAGGTAIITGFCCNLHNFELPEQITGYTVESLDQFEAMWPVRAPGIHINSLQAFDSVLKVKELADIIIPNHDPMFEKVEKIPE